MVSGAKTVPVKTLDPGLSPTLKKVFIFAPPFAKGLRVKEKRFCFYYIYSIARNCIGARELRIHV